MYRKLDAIVLFLSNNNFKKPFNTKLAGVSPG